MRLPNKAGRSQERPAPCRAGTAVLLLALFLPAFAAEWTVGIYMAADNSLNDQAYADIAEMMEIGSTSEVNIVVQVDQVARDSNPGGRRLYIRKDGADRLADLGPINMADTATLADFGRFLARQYPARNYFIILWDHGTGWSEGYGRQRPGRGGGAGPGAGIQAIFIDESHGAMMGVAGGELGAALRAVRQALGRRIRVLALDACLMGMVEVAAEVMESADYLLASEGLMPLGGLPYDELLGLLVARPTSTPAEFLPRMCDAFVAAHPGRDVSLAATDLRQLERVLPVLRRRLEEIDPADPELAEARVRVLTFPKETRPPSASDAHVDFLQLWNLAPNAAGTELALALAPLVTARSAAGARAGSRGLAGWFPASWLGFKSRFRPYLKLAWSDSVPWPQFLNAWYGRDDVKPARPEITGHRLGGRGDIRLGWTPAADLAPVTYELWEAESLAGVFSDDGDDTGNWSAIGWTSSPLRYRSPPRAFFSGTGPNIDHQLQLAAPLALPEGGLLSLYARHDTEEYEEPGRGILRNTCLIEWCEGPSWQWRPLDSLYGAAPDWRELRYRLPASPGLYLRFRYRTGARDLRAGVFLDDIRVIAFGRSRPIAAGIPDTSFYLFNLPHSAYNYFVTATDSWGNVSAASQLYPVAVEKLAEPVTRPAPFSGPCELRLDLPPGKKADVRIFTISGTLVRRFHDVEDPAIQWDGRNAHGRDLADGLYLVVVTGDGFRTMGRIARVSRQD
ncbi:MAG TPA: hypothetical protein ENN51_01360 [candidate division WOR-3 bacterium]|uniref:T9SS type A sorting domain-containing protein n=1 Tax=candidate division WOR-3 bacterium TaxID=2052148 RepID=A0A7V0T472_UNCW3|nr:hypothetical protein [candidate division WOR-3 bacterium]